MRTSICSVLISLLVAGSVLLVTACDARGFPATGSAQPVSNNATECRIPEAHPELLVALCAADPSLLGPAVGRVRIDTLRDGPDLQRQRMRVQVRILGDVFDEQQSVGTGLPWARLRVENYKVALAMALAQSERNGVDSVCYANVHKFAREFARRDISAGGGDGLLLLGYCDASDQLPLLRSLVYSDAEIGQRLSAIIALSYFCSAKANDLLVEFSQSKTLPVALSSSAGTALKSRQGELLKLWCSDEG
jgi:hypothetical protein